MQVDEIDTIKYIFYTTDAPDNSPRQVYKQIFLYFFMSRIILTKIDIVRSFNQQMYMNEYIQQLEERNLLPLTKNNKKLKIIARLCGALFSDGSLYDGSKINNYREISFALGQKEDVEELEKDFKILNYKIHKKQTKGEMTINGRTFTIEGFRVRCASTSLFLLFKSLGVPVGKKTDKKYYIPNWIMNGPKDIKKEFLSAYIGGDGPRVTIRIQDRKKHGGPHNMIDINDIEFYKRTDLIKSGYKLAEQISNLLEEFDININRVFHDKEEFPRKDGSKSVSIHIAISSKVESALNLCKLGYSYCNQKREVTRDVIKFLKVIADKRKAWKDLYNKSFELYNKGKTTKEVSETLNLSYETVFGWIKNNKNPTINQHHILYNKWRLENGNSRD